MSLLKRSHCRPCLNLLEYDRTDRREDKGGSIGEGLDVTKIGKKLQNEEFAVCIGKPDPSRCASFNFNNQKGEAHLYVIVLVLHYLTQQFLVNGDV